ncbi:hypothetical protein [Brevibacillus laterosporus]|uniref:Uncharacterized protein n=1 Tax=Brevibacillus laterosporus TaxID=1465 RepID=A0AAP3DGI1_BRELA|nr:hypothetical protein [Brevibacillus laterosporus]MCR8980473.1 hypothetical protein [Brevibacillus laterosporus]MCZ0807628.1 hypothetical protein [Brevibacillus laterosporus]MCZ0828067.1 hypothetical protein [Brevibacillus laterosporus]MCZ0851906.1 hypothetical protein [Brevibacillus laterosporus]MED1666559.1 hypothetical protein [Brevibacillus laterosporus]
MKPEDRRPDTSKNGMMKKTPLKVREESIRERGRSIVDRLNARKIQEEDNNK